MNLDLITNWKYLFEDCQTNYKKNPNVFLKTNGILESDVPWVKLIPEVAEGMNVETINRYSFGSDIDKTKLLTGRRLGDGTSSRVQYFAARDLNANVIKEYAIKLFDPTEFDPLTSPS